MIQTIPLTDAISEALSQFDAQDHEAGIRFLLENGLFGCPYSEDPKTHSLSVDPESSKTLSKRLEDFMRNQGSVQEVKIPYLKERLASSLPVTAERLDIFLSLFPVSPDTQYRLYDWLCYSLSTEAHLLSSSLCLEKIRLMYSRTSSAATHAFNRFLSWMRSEYGGTGYASCAELLPRSSSQAGRAYPLETVVDLYYFLLSDSGIQETGLVEKACSSQASAHAWAYLSLHLISALRDTDLARLPHPVLPGTPEEVLRGIREGSYHDDVYTEAIRSVRGHLDYIPLTPNKVKGHANVPDVFLVISPSLEPHFGRLFLLCEAHRLLAENCEDKPLLRPVRSYAALRKSLGEEVGALFLERDASPVGLAKSFLQCADWHAGSAQDKGTTLLKGYMLAERARSHKAGREGFSRTTMLYLQDGGLGVSDPASILRMMFERGTMSCLSSMFLNCVTGDAYQALDFSQKTLMIQELGLSPYEVEKGMALFLEAKARSEEAFKGFIRSICDAAPSQGLKDAAREAARSALLRLSSWEAPGKDPGVLCLLTAMNRTCGRPSASNCLLCSYRVDTRQSLYHLGSEYRRLQHLYQSATSPGEKHKYELLCMHCLLPAIDQVLCAARDLYGEEVYHQMTALIMDAVHGEKSGEEGQGGPSNKEVQ